MPVDTYITTQGDCFDTIAYRLWGDERSLTAIEQANPDHMDTVIFPGGVKLNIPERPAARTEQTEQPPWRTL